MGLDMYLYRGQTPQDLGGERLRPPLKKGSEPVGELEVVGYWRKANQIHGWFVTNLNDGNEAPGLLFVASKEKLEELLAVCKQVLADHGMAEELLPPTPGFFFGSLDYDEWYFTDLKETVETLEQVLVTTDFEKQTIYYCSEW